MFIYTLHEVTIIMYTITIINLKKKKKLCGLKAPKFPYYLHPKYINFYLLSMADQP